ncbi:MAG: formylglycine-generating enzyme family protein, partial [Phycisphaerae bacterium]|nr:formylglycine-generating enzyme family protein [Phycisphaerae bacterium]
GEHWDGVPPGEREPRPVVLPLPSELAPDDCYVPAGWFWSGGDPEAVDGMPRRRLWCEGLVFKRFPVTNRDYLAFLDDLVSRGREEEALRWVPRQRAGLAGEEGAMNYRREANGRFELAADAEGDLWLPDWPVINVHFGCAVAYPRWLAERSGLPWRLPGELEWEKAARGVDGRFFPCVARHLHAPS